MLSRSTKLRSSQIKYHKVAVDEEKVRLNMNSNLMRDGNHSAKLSLILSSVLLGLGLVAPVMTIHPAFGEYNWLIKAFVPEKLDPTTYSIIGSIEEMFAGEGTDLFVGIILLFFSVIFPITKLSVYWVALDNLEQGKPAGQTFDFFCNLGKLSMLDIFVLAVLVVAIKGLPGGSSVVIEWGAAAFSASILITLYISPLLKNNNPDKVL